MFKGLGDFVQQAQKVRSEMGRVQEVLKTRTMEVASGDGKVKVVANGKQQILSISIDPEFLKAADREVLQGSVTAAVNKAILGSQAMVSEEMSRVAGDLGPLSSLLKGMS